MGKKRGGGVRVSLSLSLIGSPPPLPDPIGSIETPLSEGVSLPISSDYPNTYTSGEEKTLEVRASPWRARLS